MIDLFPFPRIGRGDKNYSPLIYLKMSHLVYFLLPANQKLLQLIFLVAKVDMSPQYFTVKFYNHVAGSISVH